MLGAMDEVVDQPARDVTIEDLAIGSGIVVVAADHPSFVDARSQFIDGLRAEQRWFGRAASVGPKPFPSLIARLLQTDCIRLAAVVDGQIIAMASVSRDGEASVAVAAPSRGSGVATELMRAIAERARMAGHSKIFIRSSRRSRATTTLGSELGGTVVDMGRGRIDLIFAVGADTRTA
jgi:GNAT superfamily N-acetyltransferase